MTISTTTIKNSFSGNSSTPELTYTFKVSDEDHIQVIIRTDATGVVFSEKWNWIKISKSFLVNRNFSVFNEKHMIFRSQNF